MTVKTTKKKPKKKNSSREYTNVLVLFTTLFALLAGYLVYFQAFESRDVINNPYNARIEAMENQVIRGNILSSDGQISGFHEGKQGRNGKEGIPVWLYFLSCTWILRLWKNRN